MDDLSKEYVISWYDMNLTMHGDRPEAVRWTSKGQRLHYESLLGIDDDLNGKKILDYGCGKGDFYQYLKDNNIEVDYSGFDINGSLIELASKKYPECRFRVFDIECDDLDEDFDYIFLCGVFNLKVQGLEETIKSVLVKLFAHCRIALAFNALSAYDPRKNFELHYVSPGAMAEFAAGSLSPFFSIHHDRIPYDFTMYIRRDMRK